MKKKLKGELANFVSRGKRSKVTVAMLEEKSLTALDGLIAKNAAAKRGRPPSKHPRTASHIPLRPDERVKLGKAAESLGLPYATWARMTLLIVADWPADKQPIRGFGPQVVAGTFEEGAIVQAIKKGQVSMLDLLSEVSGKGDLLNDVVGKGGK